MEEDMESIKKPEGKRSGVVKVTMTFSEALIEKLDAMAKERGASRADIVRLALALLDAVYNEKKKGKRIVIAKDEIIESEIQF
jgi:metal-responsive CopG/Arc/MetJ family transcriptional regulator